MKKLLIIFVLICLTNFAKGQCYSVSTIPYTPSAYTGTNISLGDNVFSPTIPIGFSFCFYGAPYDSLIIFSNGVVSFNFIYYANDTMNIWNQPHTSLPNPYVGYGPKNSIMFPWQDLDPSLGGTISYSMNGVFPNRVFIVSFDNVPMDSCSKLFKGQLKLFETTNVIETYIADKDTCLDWGGFAIHGLNDPVLGPNYNVTIVSGRNYPSQWTTSNEGMKFTPTCDVCTGLAVDENNLLQNNFLIYPNPTTNNLTIETPEKATIEISNIEGQIIRTINAAEKQTTIDVADFANGIYIIKVKTDRGVAVKKFIKE